MARCVGGADLRLAVDGPLGLGVFGAEVAADDRVADAAVARGERDLDPAGLGASADVLGELAGSAWRRILGEGGKKEGRESGCEKREKGKREREKRENK